MCIMTAFTTAMQIAAQNSEMKAAGKNARREIKYQTALARQDSRDIRDKWRSAAGQQEVGYAKGGITMQGSPTDVMSDMARTGSIEARKPLASAANGNYQTRADINARAQQARYRSLNLMADAAQSTFGRITGIGM